MQKVPGCRPKRAHAWARSHESDVDCLLAQLSSMSAAAAAAAVSAEAKLKELLAKRMKLKVG